MDRITLTRNCDVARYNDQAVSFDARALDALRNRKYNFDRSKKKKKTEKE